MTVFATSTWGFDPDWWSALGFGREGDRNKLLQRCKPGDKVLVIGTFGEETASKDRGRLLGLVTIGETALKTEMLVDPSRWHEQRFRKNGLPKWPFGIPMVEAWRFIQMPLPDRRAILPRLQDDGLGMALTAFVELLPEEAEAVLALPMEPVANIYRSPAMIAKADEESFRRSNAASRGIVPNLSQFISHIADSPASVYLLELKGEGLAAVIDVSRTELAGKGLFKIGWSVDPAQRCRTINAHFPSPSRLGWKVIRQQAFPSRITAFEVEQLLLTTLAKYAHRGEMVLAPEKEVVRVWNDLTTRPLSHRPLEGTDGAAEAMNRWL